MNKALGSVMLLLGLSGALMAQVGAVPEVNASNGASALALKVLKKSSHCWVVTSVRPSR